MATKPKMKKKKKLLLPKKEANNSTATWPDLPQKLVDIIAKQPDLMQNISNGGALTKIWRAPNSKCNHINHSTPCLQLFDEEKYVEPILNASFYRCWFWYHYRLRWLTPPDQAPWKYCVGFSGHTIVTKGRATSNYHTTGSSDSIYLWFPIMGIPSVMNSLNGTKGFQLYVWCCLHRLEEVRFVL